MRILEDLLDNITLDDTNRKKSLDVINIDDESIDVDLTKYQYCMAICLGYYFKDKRSEDDDYKRIVDLKKFHDDAVDIINAYSFFDEYAIEPCVRVHDENKSPFIGEVYEEPLPREFDIRGLYERAKNKNTRSIIINGGTDYPIIETRVYFNAFISYNYNSLRRKFWRMLRALNQLKTYHQDSGYCLFTYNKEDNEDSMRSCPLVIDTTFRGCAEKYSWTYVFSPEDIDRLYAAIVENPDEHEVTNGHAFNFMQKRILDSINLKEIADNAAKEAKKYGVTLKVGKCVKPPYEAVYKRELDEALSYVAFTMKPDAGTIEIYDIEEILYQCLIKHIHYSYYGICEFAVLLAVDGTVTNQKVEDMKQELIKTSWKYNRPPYRFDREKDLCFEHD